MTLEINWKPIKAAALEAKKNAYAPYSSFAVGCSILANGQRFSGCNVENVSYPVGICAERAALAAAITAGCRNIEAVVIAGADIVVPCGMCRQALSEFNNAVPILLIGEDAEQLTSLEKLFPSPFTFK